MYAIAQQVRDWLAEGREVRIAQVVATRGFSSRDHSAALAWTDGERAGALLDGVPVEAPEAKGVSDVTVTDAQANEVGLSCGGVASVLVTRADAYPVELWDRLVAREPVCVVVHGDGVQVHTTATIRDAAPDGAARLFGRGTSTTALIDDDAVIALWPVPTLVVVGDGLIAEALERAAELLDWSFRLTPEARAAEAAAGELHRSDAFVVLSHDRAVDGPALAAALAGEAGYVGGLGSRRTQAARRDWLTEHGVAEDDQQRIHGPAGLDIDAHTPAEIAVSIVAEILASRAGSDGGALRNREGPVHVAGVQAPPPRY